MQTDLITEMHQQNLETHEDSKSTAHENTSRLFIYTFLEDSTSLLVRVWWRKCCGRRVEMISGSTYHPSDNQGQDAEQGDGPPQARNPLLCFLCDDYYSEPCLLGCYHTFCARCLRGRELDSKIACPLCGQQTMLRDGTTLPPADLLMRQLIDLANSENPPCANCDKRDKTSMYFCSTCGMRGDEGKQNGVCLTLATQKRAPSGSQWKARTYSSTFLFLLDDTRWISERSLSGLLTSLWLASQLDSNVFLSLLSPSNSLEISSHITTPPCSGSPQRSSSTRYTVHDSSHQTSFRYHYGYMPCPSNPV
uniref:RING-type domain-containing protein n=1 Tax=Timema cristinae TaxID=61476 RepID=A0A7R9DCL1_TIMCR|nr:unnamed protein product [Timema cristinae]